MHRRLALADITDLGERRTLKEQCAVFESWWMEAERETEKVRDQLAAVYHRYGLTVAAGRDLAALLRSHLLGVQIDRDAIFAALDEWEQHDG